MAFAHGKVLLFGEHAVVHGQPALAIGLSRGVAAAVVDGVPGIDAPAWGMHVCADDGSRVAAAFNALCAVLPAGVAPRRVLLDAGVPAGSGLGSSAAMAVATARALCEAASVQLDDVTLYHAALASERVFHGNPSGLDHTVAMHGGLLLFRRGDPPFVQPLRVVRAADVIVWKVEPGADTGALVRRFGAALDASGERAARLARFGRIVAAAAACLSGAATTTAAPGWDERGPDAAAAATTLGALMRDNQALLRDLDVSTPALDAACARLCAAGAAGAKLTGAGGGGCVIGVAPAGTGADVVARLGATVGVAAADIFVQPLDATPS